MRDRLPACRSLAGRWGHQLLYLCQLLYHCTFFSSYITAGTIVHQLLYHCGQALTGSTTNCTSQLLFHLSFSADTQVTPALIVFIWPASLVNALTNEVLSRSLFFPSFVSFQLEKQRLKASEMGLLASPLSNSDVDLRRPWCAAWKLHLCG